MRMLPYPTRHLSYSSLELLYEGQLSDLAGVRLSKIGML